MQERAHILSTTELSQTRGNELQCNYRSVSERNGFFTQTLNSIPSHHNTTSHMDMMNKKVNHSVILNCYKQTANIKQSTFNHSSHSTHSTPNAKPYNQNLGNNHFLVDRRSQLCINQSQQHHVHLRNHAKEQEDKSHQGEIGNNVMHKGHGVQDTGEREQNPVGQPLRFLIHLSLFQVREGTIDRIQKDNEIPSISKVENNKYITTLHPKVKMIARQRFESTTSAR